MLDRAGPLPSAPRLHVNPDVVLHNGMLSGSTAEVARARSEAVALARSHGAGNGSAAGVPSTRITVRHGDTIESLAQNYGTSIAKLAQLNPALTNLDRLPAGKTINVPLNRDVVLLAPGQTLSQIAIRYGVTVDQLARANGIGNPNHIETGTRFAAIPAHEVGLATTASTKAYIAAVRSLEGDWAKLNPSQRLTRLGTALNSQLKAAGVPPVRFAASALGGASGQFDFTTNTMQIASALLRGRTISPAAFRDLADTVYHEGRHAEQWFGMARVDLARGHDGSALGMRPAVIAAARAAPALNLRSEHGRFLGAMYASVYGSGSANRNAVLANITAANYEQYRALPEEADAWRTGGKVVNLWPR